jgi:outer membrane protein assembly factor BamB
MPRDTFTRRGWLAAVAAGLTAGCGGRSTSTPTSTSTSTSTPTAAAADEVTAGASESFERGPGNCALNSTAIADGTWPMPHHDPAGTNAAPESNGPTSFPLNERWTMSALESRVTFPVADGAYVYAVAADADAESVPSSAVLCHDPRRNGEIQWRHKVDATPIGPPVVAGDGVYVPFGTHEDARVVAVDRNDGSLLTEYGLSGRFVGGLATAGASLVVPTDRSYRVVDARTGGHCWSFTPNNVSGATRRDRKIRAAAVGGEMAYVGTGYPDGAPTTDAGHLYAVDPSVSGVQWHAELDGPVGRLAVADEVVLATTGDGISGFDPVDGTRLWRVVADAAVRPPTLAVADGTAVYGTRRTLHGLDTATGEERWSLSFGVRGDVILVGDVLFAIGRADPTTQRILLVAVDAASGGVRWQQEIYDPIVDVMAANGYLYVITTDGRLFAFTSV